MSNPFATSSSPQGGAVKLDRNPFEDDDDDDDPFDNVNPFSEAAPRKAAVPVLAAPPAPPAPISAPLPVAPPPTTPTPAAQKVNPFAAPPAVAPPPAFPSNRGAAPGKPNPFAGTTSAPPPASAPPPTKPATLASPKAPAPIEFGEPSFASDMTLGCAGLLTSGRHADLSFELPARKLRAHRCILEARCGAPFVQALEAGALGTATLEAGLLRVTCTVEVLGAPSGQSLAALLKYMYTEKFEPESLTGHGGAVALLRLVRRCEASGSSPALERLRALCENELAAAIVPETVVSNAHEAADLGASQLLRCVTHTETPALDVCASPVSLWSSLARGRSVGKVCSASPSPAHRPPLHRLPSPSQLLPAVDGARLPEARRLRAARLAAHGARGVPAAHAHRGPHSGRAHPQPC